MSDAPLDVPALERLLAHYARVENAEAARCRRLNLKSYAGADWEPDALEHDRQSLALQSLGARLSELVRDAETLRMMRESQTTTAIGGASPTRKMSVSGNDVDAQNAYNVCGRQFKLTNTHLPTCPLFENSHDQAARSPALAAPDKKL